MRKGSLDHMPYIIYTTLHDGEKNHFLFTLLPVDFKYMEDLTTFATHSDFLRRLEFLMYRESDFCIITNEQHISQIKKILA